MMEFKIWVFKELLVIIWLHTRSSIVTRPAQQAQQERESRACLIGITLDLLSNGQYNALGWDVERLSATQIWQHLKPKYTCPDTIFPGYDKR